MKPLQCRPSCQNRDPEMLSTPYFCDGNVICLILEIQISLFAIQYTLSNCQNPRWQPSDLDFGKIFNF